MEKKTRIIFGAILGCVLLCGAVAALIINGLMTTPDFSQLRSSVVIQTYSNQGIPGSKSVGPSVPGWVPFDAISRAVITAVVASEDTTFFQHEGLDYHEIKESLKKDIKEKRFARGGSTITQQVIKNVFLSNQKTVWRKVKEMVWAGQLENFLSKGEILTLYLNLIEWGPGIYGIGEASAHYFGRSPGDITPKQAAFLALLIPSPVRRYVYFKNRSLTPWAEKRMAQVMRLMKKMGSIEEGAYASVLSESLWGESPMKGTVGEEDLSDADADIPQDLTPLEPGKEEASDAPRE